MRTTALRFRTSAVLFVLVSLTLAGCAFGTREVLLKYPPQSEPGAVPTAHAAPAPTPKKTEIVLAGFNDMRQDKRLIGTVRNGFGMRTADVVATNNVPTWVTDAIKAELNNAGYKVILNATEAQLPTFLSGDIINIFCDAYFTYEGQVSLNVKVIKNGKDVVNKLFVGKGSAGMNWGATSDAYGQSLSLALSDALKQVVAELNTSLSAE